MLKIINSCPAKRLHYGIIV